MGFREFWGGRKQETVVERESKPVESAISSVPEAVVPQERKMENLRGMEAVLAEIEASRYKEAMHKLSLVNGFLSQEEINNLATMLANTILLRLASEDHSEEEMTAFVEFIVHVMNEFRR